MNQLCTDNSSKIYIKKNGTESTLSQLVRATASLNMHGKYGLSLSKVVQLAGRGYTINNATHSSFYGCLSVVEKTA